MIYDILLTIITFTENSKKKLGILKTKQEKQTLEKTRNSKNRVRDINICVLQQSLNKDIVPHVRLKQESAAPLSSNLTIFGNKTC